MKIPSICEPRKSSNVFPGHVAPASCLPSASFTVDIVVIVVVVVVG